MGSVKVPLFIIQLGVTWGTQHPRWKGKNTFHPNNINWTTVLSVRHFSFLFLLLSPYTLSSSSYMPLFRPLPLIVYSFLPYRALVHCIPLHSPCGWLFSLMHLDCGCCCWWFVVVCLPSSSSSSSLGHLLRGKWFVPSQVIFVEVLWLFPILMLLNDCIVLCYWVEWFLLLFSVWSAIGKHDVLSKKIHTDWRSIWVIQITNPFFIFFFKII